MLWYVSYGSNMCRSRFDCYLRGGRPPGASRDYPGCRDRSAPVADTCVELPGSVYFAGESTVWTGGVAGYDHTTPGPSVGRAYLITEEQFVDVATQEMLRVPGTWPALAGRIDEVVATQGILAVGPGVYETLCWLGELDSAPMLTFTGPLTYDAVEHTVPSPAYLAMLRAGLREMCVDARRLPPIHRTANGVA